MLYNICYITSNWRLYKQRGFCYVARCLLYTSQPSRWTLSEPLVSESEWAAWSWVSVSRLYPSQSEPLGAESQWAYCIRVWVSSLNLKLSLSEPLISSESEWAAWSWVWVSRFYPSLSELLESSSPSHAPAGGRAQWTAFGTFTLTCQLCLCWHGAEPNTCAAHRDWKWRALNQELCWRQRAKPSPLSRDRND